MRRTTQRLPTPRRRWSSTRTATGSEAFSRLAEAGDAQAAQVAVLMARHGERLCGQTNTAKVHRWQLITARFTPPQRY